MKILIINCLICLMTVHLGAQDQNFSDQKEIGIQFGFSHTKIFDSRLSAQTKKYILPKVGLVFTKTNKRRREEFIISYKGNLKPLATKNLWFKIINTDVTYSYQKKSGDNWIGGYFHSSALLNFPQNDRRNSFGNNPISYTINQALGLAIDKESSLWEKADTKISVSASSKLALLNYLIRPAYGGHPYPEHYLQEEHFHPTRTGMASSIVKSGKLKTINKYQSFRISLGINLYLNNKINASVSYAFDLQRNSDQKASSQVSNDLLFKLSYLY